MVTVRSVSNLFPGYYALMPGSTFVRRSEAMNLVSDVGLETVGLNKFKEVLAKAGLSASETHPKVGGSEQHRYTLRKKDCGSFVAWFCAYVEPERVSGTNPQEAVPKTNEEDQSQDLDSCQKKLVKRWFEYLRDEHSH